MNVTVFGAGSWGTALSILLARNGQTVQLVGRPSEDVASLKSVRENLRYLPGFVLPDGVEVLDDPAKATASDLTVIAVPSYAVREVAKQIQGEHPVIAVASKGLEAGSGQLLCQVVKDVLPGSDIGVLSGPNLAIEIVRGIPTAAVAASDNPESTEKIRCAFMCRTYRVYLSTDVIGVELAGALKNVLAIGAGMSDGLGFGDNTKGALLSRGLHEMTSLGLAMDAKVDTFMGLAGVGDLFATAVSGLSRNYRVGKAIAQGSSLQDALTAIDQVAEGVHTAEATMMISKKLSIEMPVFEAIDNVIRGRTQAMQAVEMLMERMPKHEVIT